MTKADIVTEVAKSTGIEKTVVGTVVEGVMESIRNSMSKKENVYLRGFGTFVVKRRAEKTARNITKGTTIKVPAHDVAAFKPASDFCEMVK